MANPTKPDIDYSYTGFQAEQQDFPFPGTQLDNDLAELKRGIDDTIDALLDVRRADGALKNKLVTADSLADELLLGIRTPTTWLTGTDYLVTDTVFVGSIVYRCLEAHESGVFATDLAAGKWEEIVDFTQAVDDAVGGVVADVEAARDQAVAAQGAAETAQGLAETAKTGAEAAAAATAADREAVGTDRAAVAVDAAAAAVDADDAAASAAAAAASESAAAASAAQAEAALSTKQDADGNLDTLSSGTTTLGTTGLDLLEASSADAALDALGFGTAGKAIAADANVADVRDYLDVPPYVADRTALKALDTAKDTVAILTQAKRGGRAIFDGSNLSSSVSADTTEALYVPPASDPTGASGAWVIRNFPFLNTVQDFLTPQMFGAVGDGVTDDLAAFNAMFAVIAARGSKIFIPPANYYFSGDLTIQDKIVTMEGVKTAVSTWGSSFTFAADKGLIIANNDGSVFRGLRFAGNASSVAGQTVGVGQFLASSGSSYVRFDDCDFSGGYRNLWLQNSLATRLTSCRFTGAIGPAAVNICDGPDSTHGVDAAEFMQCTISASGASTDCVRLNGKAHSVKMTQCAILFGNVGLRFVNTTGGSNPKFFYFSDGGFENGGSHTVYVEEGDDLKLSNAYISNDATAGDGIHMAASMDGHLSVHNTTIRGCGRDGIRCLGGRLMAVGNRVMNNGARTTGDGIRLASGVTRFVVGSNFIGAAPDGSNNQRYGIFNDASGSAGKIHDNFLIDNVTGDFGGATGGTGTGITDNL